MAILSTIRNTADKRVLDERIRQAALQKAAAQQGASQGAATGTTSVAPQPTNATSENTGNTAYQPTGATGGNTGSTAYQQYLAAQDRKAEIENQLERNRIMTSGTTQERNALLMQEAQQRTIDSLNAAGKTQQAADIQRTMDDQQRANILSSGNQQQINQYLIDQAKAQNQQNAFQAAVAAANPTTTSAAPAPSASQPAQMKDYTWYSWMGNNDMHTMNDEEKQKWNNAMAGYQLGDYRAFNQDFQTAGNWGSYVDDNGNVSGMLRYAGDGIGGYLPVNNGKVMAGLDPNHEYLFYGPGGEVYTADANGNLTRSGNWTQEKPYSALENSIPYKLVKGTATDAERDEWFTKVDPSYPVRQAAANGDQEAQQQLALMAQAEVARAGAPANNPSTGGTGAPAQNAYQRALEQATQQPAQNAPVQYQPAQNAPVPTQRGNADYYAGAETPYQAAIGEWEYGPAPEWENSEYQRQRDEALRRAQNMRFSYDPESDPVWQAYQKQYRREGQRAMQDTMAEAAMRTGGLANSYAVSAAAQAGNYYAAQLSDRLPELYNDAYQRYLAEFQKQLGISDQYAGFDQTEYGRYADELGQWNKDRSFDYGLYRDRVGDARYDDELAYDRAWNEENRDYSRSYQAQRDAIEDQRYDQQWAQQLREYADQQGWKAAEWQQYLREYGDQLSEKERQWAYQMARDAVEDNRWERQYADSRGDTAYERALRENELAYDRAWNEDERDYERGWDTTKWNQALREYDDEQAQQAWNNDYKLSGRNSGGSGGGSGSKSSGSGAAAPAPASTTTPTSSGNYDKALSDVRAYRNTHSTTEVLQYIKRLINEGTITDDEASQMLLYFGYVTGTGGGGSYAPGSPNNVLMTK